MTGVRMPGFTAQGSLGNFIQEYNLARTGSEVNGIIPTLRLAPRIAHGCCKGFCQRPCSAYPCPEGWCLLLRCPLSGKITKYFERRPDDL